MSVEKTSSIKKSIYPWLSVVEADARMIGHLAPLNHKRERFATGAQLLMKELGAEDVEYTSSTLDQLRPKWALGKKIVLLDHRTEPIAIDEDEFSGTVTVGAKSRYARNWSEAGEIYIRELTENGDVKAQKTGIYGPLDVSIPQVPYHSDMTRPYDAYVYDYDNFEAITAELDGFANVLEMVARNAGVYLPSR